MKIFISAASQEFKECRNHIASDLRAVGAEVRVQEDFQQYGGTLLEKLQNYIDECDLVIALVGNFYGCEPPPGSLPPGFPRRSYTQWEYFFAMGERLKSRPKPPKVTHVYFASQAFLSKLRRKYRLKQSPELAELQRIFAEGIRNSGKDRDKFSSVDKLRTLVLRNIPEIGAPHPKPCKLPASISKHFKGREEAIERLHKHIGASGSAASCSAYSIHGCGGVGKTRLAIEYAHRHKNDYSALLFVSADNPANLHREIAGLSGPSALDLPQQNAEKEEERENAVLSWLRNHTDWLLIVDGVDTKIAAEAVEALLPSLAGGRVIITSRWTDWSAGVESFELKELSPEAAVDFLLERTEGRRRQTPNDTRDAEKLAGRLGCLALALEQAGAFICQMRCSLGEYLKRWRDSDKAVLEWYDERLMKYPRSVATTWNATVDQLTPPALALLRQLSWLAPDPIPRSLLSGRKAQDALAELGSYSLVAFGDGGNSFYLHRLVQEVTRVRQKKEEKIDSLKAVLSRLDDLLGNLPPDDVRSWPVWDPLRPHIAAFLHHAYALNLEEYMTKLMDGLGVLLCAKGLYSEAKPLLKRALAIREKVLGPDHPDVATSLNNLATVYKTQGKYAAANPLIKRSLVISEKALGPNHPAVATALNNLAMLYYFQGKHAAVEPLCKRALAIREKALGPDHPHVANSLNNLAELYREQGKYVKAEPLYEQSLGILEKALGLNHPDLANVLNNLAELYRVQGRHAAAEPLHKRALAIREKALGSDHPDVATSLNNMAGLYYDQGRYTEVEPLLKRALAISEKALGPDHPDVATLLNNLAALYSVQGKYAKAKLLCERALVILEKTLGPDHPDVVAWRKIILLLREKIRKAKGGD